MSWSEKGLAAVNEVKKLPRYPDSLGLDILANMKARVHASFTVLMLLFQVLWKDPVAKEVYDRRAEFSLRDNTR